MQGGLNMGGKPIINMEPFVEDVSSGASSDTQKNEAITFGYFRDLAPVVQRLDNAVHRINHYPADSVVCFVNTYPLDSDLSGG